MGPFIACSVFHVISWSSHKARSPVKSTGAAEVVVAGEAINIGKSLVKSYRVLFNRPIDLVIIVDSKDFYTTLTTNGNRSTSQFEVTLV